jgi:tRNA threonylcarbamoyladenosine modification (KEOPS) complex Cgi121 subunit
LVEWAAALVAGDFDDPKAALARAAEAAKAHGSEVQLLRASAVISARHVGSAVQHAERALREGRGRTRTLGLEALVYLSGERQIRRAIARAGLAPGAREAVAVVVGGDVRAALEAVGRALGCAVAWDFPAGDGGTQERAALERTALLDIER